MADGLTLGLAGCGEGGGGGASSGTLDMLLTDSPACGYDHVYITVDHVEISSDGNTWTTLAVNSTLGRIDLLDLTNGSSAPWNNALVLTGSTSETALKTPSGQQSGYKIIGPFTVQARGPG